MSSFNDYLLFITYYFFIETLNSQLSILNSQLLKHRFHSMSSSSLLQSEHVDAVAEL